MESKKVYDAEGLGGCLPDGDVSVYPVFDGMAVYAENGRIKDITGRDYTDACMVVCDGHGDADEFTIVLRKDDFERLYRGRGHEIKSEDGKTFLSPRHAVESVFHAKDFQFYVRQGVKFQMLDGRAYASIMKSGDIPGSLETLKVNISLMPYDVIGIMFDSGASRVMLSLEDGVRYTTVKDVKYGMGKDRITAMAMVEPFVYNGAEVSEVPLAMLSERHPCILHGDVCRGMELAVKDGAAVRYGRSYGESFSLDACPFCGSALDVQNSVVKCSNAMCRKRRITAICESMECLGVDVSDIELTYDDGDTPMSWLKRRVKGTLSASIPSFVQALGIQGVGQRIGNDIEVKYNGDVYDFLYEKNASKLKRLNGVGDLMADKIIGWLDANRDYAVEFAGMFDFSRAGGVKKKTVCFDGYVDGRNFLAATAMRKGYDISTVMNKHVDILVVNSQTSESSKTAKADEYGTRVMTAEEFSFMICD